MKIQLFRGVLRTLIFLSTFLVGLTSVTAEFIPTIISNSSGGPWSYPSTWSGGIVPSENDIVEINGVVYLDSNNTVGGVLVNSGATLKKNTSTLIYGLNINGELINNGLIGGTSSKSRYMNIVVEGETINNGVFSYVDNILSKGILNNNGDILNSNIYANNSIISSENSLWDGSTYINIDSGENNTPISINFNDNFDARIRLSGNTTISGDFNYNGFFELYGHTLYVDGTKDITLYHVDGANGKIISSSSSSGDGENISITHITNGLETNIENTYAYTTNHIFTGRNLISERLYYSTVNLESLLVEDYTFLDGNITVNGDIEVTWSGTLRKRLTSGSVNLDLNGNLINNGIVGGSSSHRSLDININGDIYNGGNISQVNTINSYGNIVNSLGSVWGSNTRLALYGTGVKSEVNVDFIESFKPKLKIGRDIIIQGDIDFKGELELNGNTLYLDGTKEIYINGIGTYYGYGKIMSLNSSDGVGESITINNAYPGLETDIQDLIINGHARNITGKIIDTKGTISGYLNGEEVLVNSLVSTFNSTSISGDLTVSGSGRLYNNSTVSNISLSVNGNLKNEGTIGGLGSKTDISVFVTGDVLNKGEISHIKKLDLYSGLGNTGNIPIYTYLKWSPITGYNNYILNITGEEDVNTASTSYLLPDNIKTGSNLYWKVKGTSDTGDSQWSETKCINVPGCITIGEVILPTITGVSQEIHSPYMDDRQKVKLGEKIGKFQSGSGMILSASFENETENLYNLVFDVYKVGETTVYRTETSAGILSGTGEVIVDYLGVGDFYWNVRVEDSNGNKGENKSFGNEYIWESDFSLFEGFEPYPYGYSFRNANPDYSKLTGKYNFSYSPIHGIVTESKVDGTKWEIMDKLYPRNIFSSDKEYYSVFEALGLNEERTSLLNGNCYGLGLTALTSYNGNDTLNNYSFLKNNFSELYNNIGTGSVREKIKIENKSESEGYEWIGLDENIKDILANQLYQTEESYVLKERESIKNDGPIGVLNKIKNNPGKPYLVSFYGRSGCDSEGNNCKYTPGHTVVAYRAEGNNIYIWDNNIQYPFFRNTFGTKYSYEQYIKINTENNTFKPQNYDRDYFDKMGAVAIEDVYTQKPRPSGFADTDSLFIYKGNSNMYITDKEGKTTGYKNGNILEEIPGSYVINNSNYNSGTILENSWKKIYFLQKQNGLTIHISGEVQESYDLMVAGGDYYTKLSGVDTSSGQLDTFKITRENIEIDFDDNKTGGYNLMIDNFQETSTGTVYIDSVESITEPQNYIISWTGVINNSNDAVTYQTDTDLDGIYDKSINLPPVYQDLEVPETNYSFSGELTVNSTGSYIETVNIELSSMDNGGGTGIDTIYYAIGSNTGTLVYLPYTENITVNGVGDYTLNYYAADNFGNTEEVKTTNFSLAERPETYAGNISGYVYDDSNQNGILDDGEKFMAGFKICMDLNNNNNCEEGVEPFKVTNNTGYYEFDSLETGSYKILKANRDKWINTNNNGYYDIVLSNGEIVSNMNFGIFKEKGNNKK